MFRYFACVFHKIATALEREDSSLFDEDSIAFSTDNIATEALSASLGICSCGVCTSKPHSGVLPIPADKAEHVKVERLLLAYTCTV